ncbi:MAG: Protein of unknown function (DUF2769) [Methanobacterium sp. Maddingley MBC34]|nr:MAG: Protein of unknown function (DUF2769) [Methanobacterium sp. Maddingley MBC34]
MERRGIIMSKVEFSLENVKKCICNTCPVQVDSACFKEKQMKVQEMMPKIMAGEMAPKPEMVPGLYCATGKTMCDDVDFEKMCQCNECPLWEEYDLSNGEPMGYYCRDGIAK